MRIARRWRVAWGLLIFMAPLGCATPAHSAIIHLSGMIASQSLASVTAIAPVMAEVSCNQHAAKTNSNGTFKLDVPVSQNSNYTCSVQDNINYVPVTHTIVIPNAGNYVLNFTTDSLHLGCTTHANEFDCPLVQFTPGQIVATMTYRESKHTVVNGHLRCSTQYSTSTAGSAMWYTAKVDTSGAYVVDAVSPGVYTCIVYDPDFLVISGINVQPAQSTTTHVTVCELHCPRLRYHDGVVIHDVTVYLVFWLPAGKTFDPVNGSAAFEQKAAQFITDVSGTPYLNVLAQYGDFLGGIQNQYTLGGTYVYTQPYPHAGTVADPLTDGDVQGAIGQSQQANSIWHQTNESMFVLFTAYNVNECNESYCSYDRKHGYCGYHSADYNVPPMRYAYIADANYCADYGTTPNGLIIDATIDTLDHEVAETITDPSPFSGWNDDTLNNSAIGGEIGDLCENDFSSTLPDGGDITLHGHDYFIQPLWSNKASACAFSG